MNKSEKRYFKLYTQLHAKKDSRQLLKLYDIIESQKSFQQKDLIDLFDTKSQKNNLSQYKSELYKLILRSLRSFHAKHFHRIGVQNYKSDFEILYFKGLINNAEESIQNIKSQFENIPDVLDEFTSNKMEMKLLIRKNNISEIADFSNSYYDKQIVLMDQMRRELQIESIFLNVYHLFRKSFGISFSILESSFKDQEVKIALMEISDNDSSTVKIYYWRCLTYIYLFRKEYSKVKASIQKILKELMDIRVKDFTVWEDITIQLQNLFYVEVMQKNIRSAVNIYQQIQKNFASNLLMQNYSLLYRVQSGLVALYMDCGELRRAQLFALKIESQVDDQKGDDMGFATLTLNLAWLYIFTRQYDKTSSLLDRLTRKKQLDEIEGIAISLRIIKIVLLLQFGDYKTLSSYSRSIQRFADQMSISDPLLKSFLTFCRTFEQKIEYQAEKILYQNFFIQFDTLFRGAKTINPTFEQLRVWINEKVTGKTYSALLKERE